MGNVHSLQTHRMRRADQLLAVADRGMTALNRAFCGSLLHEAIALVRANFPDIKLRDAWVYHFQRDHWEFHGPDKFYWHGSADNAYDARYKGWMAWLRSKGIIDASTDID